MYFAICGEMFQSCLILFLVFFIQLQSMQLWKQSVENKLVAVAQQRPPAPMFSAGLCGAAPPAALSVSTPHVADVSFPDSGFQSTNNQQAAQEDSFLSSGTADSVKTVRALSPVRSGGGVDSADCSLLDEYLSSVQQREEEADEASSDKTETPQPSPSRTPSTDVSPTQKATQTTPDSV